MITPAQLEQVKASVDMLDLAGRYTTLKRESRREMSGPCPICKQGEDCFHAHVDGWWFCRKCHLKRSDVFGFVMAIDGVGFVEAYTQLSDGTFRTVTPVKPQRQERKQDLWYEPEWQRRADLRIESAAGVLDTPVGAPGRAYLEQRGIELYTWRAWVLGYVPDAPWKDKQQDRWLRVPAITMPWLRHDNDLIMGLRYRYIDSRPDNQRFINQGGSNCILYGMHMLDFSASTLVIVEGEINALSIWQAARDLGLTVVSIGSQSIKQETFDAIGRLSAKFQRCLVWCDEPGNALDVKDVVRAPGVIPMRSPLRNGKKVDANDMLQRGLLREFMTCKLEDSDHA